MKTRDRERREGASEKSDRFGGVRQDRACVCVCVWAEQARACGTDKRSASERRSWVANLLS